MSIQYTFMLCIYYDIEKILIRRDTSLFALDIRFIHTPKIQLKATQKLLAIVSLAQHILLRQIYTDRFFGFTGSRESFCDNACDCVVVV